MKNFKLLVLAVVAVVLVGSIIICITINPLVAIGLAPVLLAVAQILRAIADSTVSTGPATTAAPTTELPTAEISRPVPGPAAGECAPTPGPDTTASPPIDAPAPQPGAEGPLP